MSMDEIKTEMLSVHIGPDDDNEGRLESYKRVQLLLEQELQKNFVEPIRVILNDNFEFTVITSVEAPDCICEHTGACTACKRETHAILDRLFDIITQAGLHKMLSFWVSAYPRHILDTDIT